MPHRDHQLELLETMNQKEIDRFPISTSDSLLHHPNPGKETEARKINRRRRKRVQIPKIEEGEIPSTIREESGEDHRRERPRSPDWPSRAMDA
jgi:hypothetical protein